MIFLKNFKTKIVLWSFDRTLKLKPMGRNSKSVNLLDFEKFNFEISKLRTIIVTSYDVTYQNWVYIMKADGCVFSTIYFLFWDSIVFAIYREKSIFWIIANFSYSRAWTTDMYISKDAEFYKEAKYIKQNLFWFRFRDSSRKNKILYCVE